MPKKPKELPPEFKTLGEWLDYLAQQGKKPPELVQETNCSPSYAYKFFNKHRKALEEKATEVGAEESEISMEEVVIEEPTAEEVDEKMAKARKEFQDNATPVIEEIVTTGSVTTRTLGMLFKAVNSPLTKFFPRYAMSDKECLELGSMWKPIINRKLKDSIDKGEDLDFWFAMLATVAILGSRYGLVIYDKVSEGKKQ